MSIDGSSATVSGTTLSFVAAAVASGRATGANAAAVVARAANTAAFIFFVPARRSASRVRPSETVSCHVCVLAVRMTGAGVLRAAASACATAAASRGAAAACLDPPGWESPFWESLLPRDYETRPVAT